MVLAVAARQNFDRFHPVINLDRIAMQQQVLKIAVNGDPAHGRAVTVGMVIALAPIRIDREAVRIRQYRRQ